MRLLICLLLTACWCSQAAQVQLSWFPASSINPVTICTTTNVTYTLASLTATTNRVKQQWAVHNYGASSNILSSQVLNSWAYYFSSLQEHTLVTPDMLSGWSVLATRPENTGTYMVTIGAEHNRFFTVQDGATSSVNLGWDASPPANVIGYRLYYGSASHTYTNSIDLGKVLTCTVPGLERGDTYWFAVTADDSNGKESALSGEISYTIPRTDYSVFIKRF